MIWTVYFLNRFPPQPPPSLGRSHKLKRKAVLKRCFDLFWLYNIHSWLHFPNCFILTLRIFWPLNDSRSLKDDLPVIVLFRSSAVERKATTRMSFRWENSVCCTSPPTLSLPKVSCQLINHLCPVLSAKNPTSIWILGGKVLESVPLLASPLLPGGKALNHNYCHGDSAGLTAQCNTPASLWLIFTSHSAMSG